MNLLFLFYTKDTIIVYKEIIKNDAEKRKIAIFADAENLKEIAEL